MSSPSNPNAQFLELHLAHQKTLMGYLLATVHDFQLAEDLLQRITLILWEKFAEGEKPVSYLAWAFGVARRVVARHFRDRQGREIALTFEVLDRLAVTESSAERLAAQSRVLAGCVEKLPQELRSLLQLRYEEELSLENLAKRLGQTMAAINMKLVRIRRTLLDCSRRAVEAEASP